MERGILRGQGLMLTSRGGGGGIGRRVYVFRACKFKYIESEQVNRDMRWKWLS